MRGIRAVLVALLLAVLALAAASPAAAAQPGIVAAGTDHFRFASYSARFELGRDSDGRSTLTTTETFVALFPDTDQNRGMRRSIPTGFDGHPTDVDLVSVTDENGAARPVETETEDGFLIVTSAADGFVHGAQSYVFTYTQRTVTLDSEQTASGLDEFYWDTNGTGWLQSFDAYSIAIVAGADQGLTPIAADCYRGAEGSTQSCTIEAADAPGTLATASGSGLGPGENVTIALGFAPGTFTPRDDSYFASPWSIVQILGFVLAIAAVVGAIVIRATLLRNGRGRPTVIAEYDPPAASIFSSAQVSGHAAKATAAAFVDLAVRGIVQIEERSETGFLGREKESYALRLIDPSGAGRQRRFVRPRPLAPDEREFLTVIFGSALAPGTERDLSEKDAVFGKNVTAFVSKLPARARAEGLRKSGVTAASVWTASLGVLGALAAIVGGILLLAGALGGAVPLVVMLVAFASIFVTLFLLIKAPLTAAGAELRDHIRGLELYIRLAEADRFRMLQSPDGADRRSVGTDEVVELTERLLPYAVLFGQEKQWAAALAVAYEQAEQIPGWYAGSHGFNAALFAGSVSSFAGSAAASWSGSASSSSSGGSGGGGSSGGGGGGGGGGGV